MPLRELNYEAARFLILRRAASLLPALCVAACAAVSPRHGWEDRLRGNAIVLLGEVHDNGEQHRQRLAVLRRAFAAGWRPAIAMEQFDRERRGDIERARSEKPVDARHLIALSAPSRELSGGWNWDFYRPFVALALEYGVPLIAANLSDEDTRKVARAGFTAVFDDEARRRLGLGESIPPEVQKMQEKEIDDGHCNALPQSSLPAMARGQFARDAVMARALREHAKGGVVLLAGNGHVRRDIGVPRWLDPGERARVFAVGYLEQGSPEPAPGSYDATVLTVAAKRPDPCEKFAKRKRS